MKKHSLPPFIGLPQGFILVDELVASVDTSHRSIVLLDSTRLGNSEAHKLSIAVFASPFTG